MESARGPGAILDAARDLFLEFGLRRTTMDDVARRAGVGRVTVYRHYADKNALFAEVVMRECARGLREIERAIAPHEGDVEAFLVEWFTQMVVVAFEHPLRKRLLVSDPEWFVFHVTLDGQPILALGIEYVASIVRRVQARGVATAHDPTVLGEVILRLLHSIHLTPGGTIGTTDPEELRSRVRTHLLPIVMPQSKG